MAWRWADATLHDHTAWQTVEGLRQRPPASTVEGLVGAMAMVSGQAKEANRNNVDIWIPGAFKGVDRVDQVFASSTINIEEVEVVRKATRRSTRGNTWPLFVRHGRHSIGLIRAFNSRPPRNVGFQHLMVMLTSVMDTNVVRRGAEGILRHVQESEYWQEVLRIAQAGKPNQGVRGFADLIYLTIAYWTYIVMGGDMIKQGREAELVLIHSAESMASAMIKFWFSLWSVQYLQGWALPMTQDRLTFAYILMTHEDLIDPDRRAREMIPNAREVIDEIARRYLNLDTPGYYINFQGRELELPDEPTPVPIVQEPLEEIEAPPVVVPNDGADDVFVAPYGDVVEELPLEEPPPSLPERRPRTGPEMEDLSPRGNRRLQWDVLASLSVLDEQVPEAVVPEAEPEVEPENVSTALMRAARPSPYTLEMTDFGRRVKDILTETLPATHWSSLEATLSVLTERISAEVGVPAFYGLLQDPNLIEFAVLRMLDPHARYSPEWDPEAPDSVLTRNTLMMQVLFSNVGSGALTAVADWIGNYRDPTPVLAPEDVNLIMQVSSFMIIRWATLNIAKLRQELAYWESDYRRQRETYELGEAIRVKYEDREMVLKAEIETLQEEFVEAQAGLIAILVETGYQEAGYKPGTMAALLNAINVAMRTMHTEHRRLAALFATQPTVENTGAQTDLQEVPRQTAEVMVADAGLQTDPVTQDLVSLALQIRAESDAPAARVSVASWGGGPSPSRRNSGTSPRNTVTMSVGTMVVMETSDKGTEVMLPWEARSRRSTAEAGTTTADFVVLGLPDALPDVPPLDLRQVHNDSGSSFGAQPRTPLDTPRSDRAVGYQPDDVGSDASGALRPADPDNYVPAGWGGSVAGGSTDAVDGASDGTGSGPSGGPPPAPPPRPPAGAGAGPGRAPPGPGGAGPPRATQPPADLPPIHRRRIVTNHGNLAERVGPPPAAGQAYRNSIAYRALLSAQAGNPALIKDNATTWDPKLKMLRPKYKPGPKKGSEMAMRVAGRARAARRNAVPVQVMRNRPQPVRTELQRAREKALVAGLRSAQDCAVNEAMDIIGN